MGRLFRQRKAQIWDYVAHLRGVAVVMNVLRAKEVVVVNQAQCSLSSLCGRLRTGRRLAD